MRLQRFNTQFIALSLAVLTFVATAPVSAAEIAAPTNIGSVSAVGSVQLRGVGISEGTLFSGDRLNVAPGAYAKVVLGTGPKVEVGQVGGSSDVTVSRDANAVNIEMKSGNIAFSANGQKPVRVHVGGYEITASGQSRGTVAFVGSSAFDVRVLEGSVTIRNTATKQSFTASKGSERLISLNNTSNPSGVLLASSAPTAIPAPAMPAPRQGLSDGAKKALLITTVLGSAAAIAILMTKNDDTDSEAAKRLEQTKLANNVAAVEATAAAVASNNASITSTANSLAAAVNASTTLTAAQKTAITNQTAAITAAAAVSTANLNSLQVQINTAKASIANGTGTQAQLNLLLQQEEQERTNSNNLAAQLNTLLNANRTLAGAPQGSVGTVGPPAQSSASIPD